MILEKKIDKRLYAISRLVRTGAYLADVGTDHGYLICYLAQNGKIRGGIASDINEQPLKKAQGLIYRLNLSDKIKTRVSDGLKDIMAFEVTDIVIAGMGGEMIAKIIDECQWIRNPEKNIILQPQSRANVLRRVLFRDGFEIVSEDIARQGKFYYTVMKVRYSGKTQEIDTYYAHVGKIPEKLNEDSAVYLEKTERTLRLKAQHASSDENRDAWLKASEKIRGQLDEYYSSKE